MACRLKAHVSWNLDSHSLTTEIISEGLSAEPQPREGYLAVCSVKRDSLPESSPGELVY